MPEGIAVLGAEPAAPIVAVAAELGGAGLGIKFASVGTKTKIAAAEGDFGAGEMGFDFDGGAVAAVMAADRAVDPVVEAPAEAVDAELLVTFEEAAEENLAGVGAAVIVGVAQENNFGRGRDDDAVAPGDEAGGETEVVGEQMGFVVDTVVVGVFEHADAAAGFAFA